MEADYRQTIQQSHEIDAVDEDLQKMNEYWSNGYGLDMEGLDNDFGMNNLDTKMPEYDESGLPKTEQYVFGKST